MTRQFPLYSVFLLYSDSSYPFLAHSSLARCDYDTAIHISNLALSEKQNDVQALYIKAVCYSNLPDREKEYRLVLNEIILLDPHHKEARNRLIALAKNSSPLQAFQLLPEPSDDEDSETRLYRALVYTEIKRYKEALDVLSTLNGAAFDSHFEARLCRARAFRGTGDYAPAYLHASKAVELKPCEASFMTRASIVLEYWEWLRRRGLVTFGDDGTKLGLAHARLVAGVPHSVIMLTESQNARLGTSSVGPIAAPSASSPVDTPLDASSLSVSSMSRSAAVTRSRLLASKAQIVPAKLPPISDLLSVALQDLNRLVDLNPKSIQALTKRATILHITGAFVPAIDDLQRVLNSEMLQPAERPRLVLKFTRLLFDSEDYDNIVRAHHLLNNQLHIALDLEILMADVAALMVIGRISDLQASERLVNSALRSIDDREAHSLSPPSRGPLLLLMARINKRISELLEMNEEIAKEGTSTLIGSATASQGAVEKGALERQRCIQYANQAASVIADPRILVRESAFWRQSGEPDLALMFANQALLVDPGNLPAKLSKAAELYAEGESVLETLQGLSDRDPQVRLYRVLGSSYDRTEAKLDALDSYLNKLADPASDFAYARLDIRMRCWLTAQFNRALVLWRLGDRDSARDTFLEVLRSAPTHPGALIHLAELLVLEGDLQHAIYYFEKRLNQAYSRRLRVHLLVRIATCYHQIQSYSQCLTVIDEALKLNPTHQETLALKAEAERLNTRIGAALAYTRETFSSASHYVKKLWNTPSSDPTKK